MVNKVILEGVLARAPYMTKSQNGGKKALFTLEIKTYEEGATTKYIEVECYGKSAEKIENCKGGETLYVEASLYRYKSAKYDCYMLAVGAKTVEIANAVSTVQPQQENSADYEYNISEDDLPF